MLICAIYALGIYAQGILSTAISTGKYSVIMKKKRAFGLRQNKANSNQNKPNIT